MAHAAAFSRDKRFRLRRLLHVLMGLEYLLHPPRVCACSSQRRRKKRERIQRRIQRSEIAEEHDQATDGERAVVRV